jgi:hypothetical protein
MRTAVSACAAVLVVAGGGAARLAQATPNINGVWEVAGKIQELKTVDGKTPPLRPAAAKVYAEHVAMWKKGDLSYDPTARCIGPGLPRMLYLPYPFQIIQHDHPKEITYLFQWNYWDGHVYLTKKQLPVPYPLSLGVSTGQWQGDTLVIHTYGLRADNTLLDAAGMPHSTQMQVWQHIHLTDHRRVMVDRVTIDDPETFTRSWDTEVRFRRLPADTEIPLDICLDRTDAGKPAVDWSRKLARPAQVATASRGGRP